MEVRSTLQEQTKALLPRCARRRRSCNATMDCVEAKICQFDCPSVRHGHVSKLLQLGNGHGNGGICSEVRVQCCHCHAGAGFPVGLTKEPEDFAGRLAERHYRLHRISSRYSATCRRNPGSFGLSFDPKPLNATSISFML